MDGTCKKEKCPFYKEHGKNCPFYIETWWQEGNNGKTSLVQDCAPIRSMLMQQNFHNRMIGMQQSVESQRNRTEELRISLNTILEQTREYIHFQLREQSKKLVKNPKSSVKKLISYFKGDV